MSTEDTTNSNATPPTPPENGAGPEAAAAEAASRGRGRPSIAELEAKQRALSEREEEVKRRELEIEIAAAEANINFRERDLDLKQREQQVQQQPMFTARPAARSGDVRSADLSEPVRGRRFKGGGDMPNKYHIPPETIPAGMSYQWNNHTVFGQEQHAYSSFMEMQGWEPVPASRYPHLVPRDTPANAPIIIDGQMLVERPAEWTMEALQEGIEAAYSQVQTKEQQLYGTPDGQLQRSRANGTNEFIQVGKSVEPGTPHTPNYPYEQPGVGATFIE